MICAVLQMVRDRCLHAA